jgi:hypothetical protein
VEIGQPRQRRHPRRAERRDVDHGRGDKPGDPGPREALDQLPDLLVVRDMRQDEREREPDRRDRDADHDPALPPGPLLLFGLFELHPDQLVLRMLRNAGLDL